MWAALIFGIISAAMSAFQGYSSSQEAASQQQAQAAVLEANAKVREQNASLEAERVNLEAWQQDRQKSALRRQLRDVRGQNRVSLGAGNVDPWSGSAQDVELGNIDRFAADMGDNAYAVALKKWEASERERLGRQEAGIMRRNASWLMASSGNPATSLLTASMAGFGGFTQGYTSAGGSIGGLFGGSRK